MYGRDVCVYMCRYLSLYYSLGEILCLSWGGVIVCAAASFRVPLHSLCPAAPSVRVCVHVSGGVNLCVVYTCVCMFVFSCTPSIALP